MTRTAVSSETGGTPLQADAFGVLVLLGVPAGKALRRTIIREDALRPPARDNVIRSRLRRPVFAEAAEGGLGWWFGDLSRQGLASDTAN